MTIRKKLLKIQQELKAPKNIFNNYGGFHYRNAEGILESLKPLLDELKCLILLEDTLVMVGERYYVKATAKLLDTESIEEIRVSAYAREEETKKGMDGSQITGASSSYARKYALNGLLAIDDVKDSDTTNDVSQGSQVTKKQEDFIKSLYTKEEIEKMLANIGKNSLSELTVEEASDAINHRSKKK